MKKKLMMVAVLLGALSLGACVDDNESQSVTDLRGAKAEQLRSIAAMNNAEAEAKLIYANAEAQLKAAEAALKQALADKAAAEALIKQLEAQLAQDTYDADLAAALAQAEKERLEAEKEIARINGEIQTNQLQLGKEIAEIQAQLLQAQLDLQGKEDYAAQEAMARLEKLAKNYSTALYSYTEEKNNLADLNTDLLELQADLDDWKARKEEKIAKNNATIALIDQQIAYFKQYENYTEDVDALKNEYALKESERDQAEDAMTAAQKELTNLETAITENQDLKDLRKTVNQNTLVDLLNNSAAYSYTIGATTVSFASYNPLVSKKNVRTPIEKEGYTKYVYKSMEIETQTPDLRPLDIAIKQANAEIDALKDDINNATTGTKVLLDAAEKAAKEAETKWKANPQQITDTEYQTILGDLQTAKDNYETDVQELEEAEATMAEIDAMYKVVSGGTTELQAAVDAYNKALAEAMAPVAEQAFALQDATELYNDLKAEADAMYAVISGNGVEEMTLEDYLCEMLLQYQGGGYYTDAALNNSWISVDGILYNNYSGTYYNSVFSIWIDLYATIIRTNAGTLKGAAAIQEAIEGLETQKEKLQARNEDYSKATTKEQTIAEQEAEIAGLAEIVNVLEIKVAQYKAALDAAVAEYDTEEPAA